MRKLMRITGSDLQLAVLLALIVSSKGLLRVLLVFLLLLLLLSLLVVHRKPLKDALFQIF